MSARAAVVPIASYLALALFGMAVSAIYISETSVSIALADISGAYGASMTATAWVSTIYVLMVGIFVPIAPTVGERVGYKTTFLFAYTLFALGSLLSCFSPNLTTLLIGRAIQGGGGAMIAPSIMRLVGELFPKERVGAATGILAGCGGAGMAIGPTLAGFLLDNFNWHSIFWVNVCLGCIIVPMGYLLVNVPSEKRPVRFDWWGMALIAISSCSILVALAEGNASWNTEGWTSPFMLSMYSISAISFVGLLFRELTFEAPALLLRLFSNANYALASIAIFVVGFALLGAGFILPVFMQDYLGYSKLNSGLTFGPGGLCQFLIALFIARISQRTGLILPITVGFFFTALSFYVASSISLQSTFATFTWISVFRGIGMGLVITPLFSLAMGSVDKKMLSYGTSAFYFMYQLGMSVGVALFETMMIRRTIFHTAVLAEAVNPHGAAYEHYFRGIYTSIAQTGAGATHLLTGQVQTLIADHIKKVAYACSLGEVMLVTLWMSIGSALILLLYKLFTRSGT